MAASLDEARAALDQRLVEGTGRLLTAPEGGGCPAAAALAAEFGRSMQTALELLNPMMALEAIEAMRAGLENAGGYTGCLLYTSEQIETEQQLAVKYDVSRGTVRQAITSLVNEGLLTKIQGRGTFKSGVALDHSSAVIKLSLIHIYTACRSETHL